MSFNLPLYSYQVLFRSQCGEGLTRGIIINGFGARISACWMDAPPRKKGKRKKRLHRPDLHCTAALRVCATLLKSCGSVPRPWRCWGRGTILEHRKEREALSEFENGNTSLPIRLEAAPLARSPSTLCKSSTPLLMRQVREAGELNRAMERWA